MELPLPPFTLRLLLLVAFAIVVVTWDLLRRPRQPTRLQEYSFLFACAAAAAACGVLVDQITCSISPDYFVLGKGISDGEGFRYRVAALGAKAGVSAGVVLGAVYLFANTFRSAAPRVPYRDLATLTWKPAMCAALIGALGAVLFSPLLPDGLAVDLKEVLEDHEISAFAVVWGVHCGLYLGLISGTAWGVWTIRRKPVLTPPVYGGGQQGSAGHECGGCLETRIK